MQWSQGDWKHIIVIITDASAHRPETAYQLASQFSQKGKVTAILAKTNNMDKKAPSFLRTLANRGQGEYIEDSGRMLNSLIRATLTK